jgi:ADP-ribose pyrophosphatase YjhB (NUDIX family)
VTEPQAYFSLGPWVYCPLCAGALEITRKEELPRRYCPRCDRVYYHNPVPAAGGVIVVDDRVLLVRRKFRPRVGEWTFPAGFLEYYESPEHCAVREVAEETGLQTKVDGVFGVYAGHDDPRFTALLVLFRMTVTGGSLAPGDDACEARFFGPTEVPTAIAFTAHQSALKELFGARLRVLPAQPAGAPERTTNQAGGGKIP